MFLGTIQSKKSHAHEIVNNNRGAAYLIPIAITLAVTTISAMNSYDYLIQSQKTHQLHTSYLEGRNEVQKLVSTKGDNRALCSILDFQKTLTQTQVISNTALPLTVYDISTLGSGTDAPTVLFQSGGKTPAGFVTKTSTIRIEGAQFAQTNFLFEGKNRIEWDTGEQTFFVDGAPVPEEGLLIEDFELGGVYHTVGTIYPHGIYENFVEDKGTPNLDSPLILAPTQTTQPVPIQAFINVSIKHPTTKKQINVTELPVNLIAQWEDQNTLTIQGCQDVNNSIIARHCLLIGGKPQQDANFNTTCSKEEYAQALVEDNCSTLRGVYIPAGAPNGGPANGKGQCYRHGNYRWTTPSP